MLPQADIRPSYLFDHLVSASDERRGHLEPERPRRLEIDDQFEFGRELHREVTGLRAFQDFDDVICWRRKFSGMLIP